MEKWRIIFYETPAGNSPVKDFIRSLEKSVEVRTYKPVDGRKEFEGTLKAFDEETVTIEEDGNARTFLRKDVALIRLAVEF